MTEEQIQDFQDLMDQLMTVATVGVYDTAPQEVAILDYLNRLTEVEYQRGYRAGYVRASCVYACQETHSVN